VEAADELTAHQVISVDASVPEITHQKPVAEFAESSGRNSNAPGRVEVAARDHAPAEVLDAERGKSGGELRVLERTRKIDGRERTVEYIDFVVIKVGGVQQAAHAIRAQGDQPSERHSPSSSAVSGLGALAASSRSKESSRLKVFIAFL